MTGGRAEGEFPPSRLCRGGVDATRVFRHKQTCHESSSGLPEWRLDGRSLWPQWNNPGQPGTGRSLFWQHGKQQAVRQGDWKLIQTSDREQPFFVFFSLKIPHSPETLHTLDPLFQDRGWPECERVHAARIVYPDRQVGQVVSLIDSLGLGENTLILYSSDNGGHSEGGYKHPSVDPCKHDHTFFSSNAPLRGYKRDLYGGGLRVPFIARWPGKIEAGGVSSHVGAFWDVRAMEQQKKAQHEPNEHYPYGGLAAPE